MKRFVLAGFAVVLTLATAVVAFHLGASRRVIVNPFPATSSGSQPVPSVTRSSASRAVAGTGPAVATSQFMNSWLSTDEARRRAGLEATCAPRLAALLSLTDLGKVPRARPVGAPALLVEAAVGVTYLQHLSDGSAVDVDLVPDPERTSGWLVTGVRPHGG